MANPEHLEILKRGKEKFKEWRWGHIYAKLDLSGADLSGADLSSANLMWADLSGANLSGANLSGANLSEAKLSGANLIDADLRGADLRGADLSGADLSGADLTKAKLFGTPDLPPPIKIISQGTSDPTPPIKIISQGTSDPTPPIRIDKKEVISEELVQCSVYSPPSAKQNSHIMIQAFVHFAEQLSEVQKLATSFDESSALRGFKTFTTALPKGSKLTLHLLIPGLNIDEPLQTIEWQGRPEPVQFAAYVPPAKSLGNVIGQVRVLFDNVPIGSMKFLLKVVEGEISEREKLPHPTENEFHHYDKAFVSYASQDRLEVLKRVQILKALRINIFQDVLSLEPGERWKEGLYKHIDKSDLFLLFWSSAAQRSEWVMNEVRYAISRKCGNDFFPPDIIPVIIEGPPPPSPPPELEHLHFNDHLIYFMAGQQQSGSKPMARRKAKKGSAKGRTQ